MAKETLEGLDENQLDGFIKDVEKAGHLMEIFQNTGDSTIPAIISKLRELADYSDKVGLDVKIADTVGNSVGIAGSLLFISGLIAAPFTAGLSTILCVAGTGISVAGGLTSVGANITSTVATNNTVKEAKPILEELKNSVQSLVQQLEASIQALERLETHLDVNYWLKAVLSIITSGGKLTEDKILQVVGESLDKLSGPKSQHFRLKENLPKFVKGISALVAIKQNPLLVQQAKQVGALFTASSPGISRDVSKVSTTLKGSPAFMTASQMAVGGALAGAAILFSTLSIIQTWTSPNETPAATVLRRIANELEEVYPFIQQ